jgi:AcrR family transcriptional regulator
MTDQTTTQANGKRARSKAANRQAILEAARGVFALSGYEATTVRDIIRATDLGTGTFYNYFKSKEEVFQALSSDSVRRFRPLLGEVRQQSDSFEDFVHGAYRAYFQFLSDENSEAIQGGAPHIALIGVRVDTPEMLTIFEEIRTMFEEMLSAGEAPRVDSEYLAAAAIGIARDLGDHMLLRRPVDVDEATRFAASLLLGGLQAVLFDA